MSIAGKEITYWGGWFMARCKATKPLTQQQARRRHDRGELYTALIGDPLRPDLYIDVRLEVGHVGVHHLDRQLRCEAAKLFGVGDSRWVSASDLLFPENHQLFRYTDDAAESWSVAEEYTMRPDGTGMVVIRDTLKKEQVSWEVDQMGDMSDLWVPVPAFGEYDAVAAWEADAPVAKPN